MYKNVFESSQGGMLKLANPKQEHRNERQSGRLRLNFLDCRAEMCIHLYEEFCVNTIFSLVCRFPDKIRSLKQSPGDLCALILSLTLTLKLCST